MAPHCRVDGLSTCSGILCHFSPLSTRLECIGVSAWEKEWAIGRCYFADYDWLLAGIVAASHYRVAQYGGFSDWRRDGCCGAVHDFRVVKLVDISHYGGRGGWQYNPKSDLWLVADDNELGRRIWRGDPSPLFTLRCCNEFGGWSILRRVVGTAPDGSHVVGHSGGCESEWTGYRWFDNLYCISGLLSNCDSSIHWSQRSRS